MIDVKEFVKQKYNIERELYLHNKVDDMDYVDLIQLLNDFQQQLLNKHDVSGALPTLEDAWNAGVDEGGSRTGNFEWGIRRKDIEFSEWYAAELEYRSLGQ